METYWQRARKLAWDQTIKLVGIDSTERTVFRVIVAALTIVGVWYFGSTEAWSSQLVGKIIVTGIVVGAVPLIFVWKLLLVVPASHSAALEETIAGLQRSTEPVLEF